MTPKRSSKRTPSPTAEDGVMKGRSLFSSEDNPNPTNTKSQRKQPPPSKTAEDGAVQGRPLVAYTKKLKVSKFHRLYKKAWRQEVFGNQAFITWSARTADHSGRAISKCPGWWAEASTDQADAHSYDEIAALILSGLKAYDPSLGGSMPQLWSSMQNLFSLGDLKDADDDKGSWSLCEYFLCLATQCPTVVFSFATAQRVITTDDKSPRFWEFSLVFDLTLIVQRAEPLTWMWLAAAKFFAHPWTGPAIIPPIVEEFERLERELKIAKAQSKSKKRPASTPENPKGAKAHDSRPSPSVQMQTELTPPKGRSNLYQRTPPLDATPPRQQVVMSDAVQVIAGTPTGTQEASLPADDVAVANTHRGRTSAENGAEEHNSAPTYRDTVAALHAPTVPVTTDKRLMRLLAVHWNASPFRHITIFNVSVVFDWQGVGSSDFNQVQTAYNAFHQFASGIWGEITFTEFDEKAKDWAHLKIYLDPNFGNPYILNKPGKTGSKTFKTRMRFGMDTAPPILMQELCSVLSSEPWVGVFPTPIQVSDMVRLGFLPLLPQELAIGPYCKDLMRLCDFQYPIGLMQEWVNNPRFFSAKFTGSS
ncbi:unnamed protein product [Cylindrotheca closterium]|uniref:Uncharacterized protein n=1 Tax=Cylindrotheca closterium TaxID=2856 RepID=A0AAD2G6A3_9STRA|nr:unnamed protein product [Cylindrotheca closterium]